MLVGLIIMISREEYDAADGDFTRVLVRGTEDPDT